jgi:multidrug efflux pump subunit AcrB
MSPLANIASFTNAVSLMKINHQELSPAVTLYFNLLPNTALGDIVTKINDKVNELNLPTSVSAGFRGNAAAFKKSLTGELFLIIAALLAVYVI